MRGLFTCLLLLVGLEAMPQETFYKFWVQLTDKDHNEYSIDRPEEFLSQRSLDRRTRQGIQISEQDLPVSDAYLDSLGEYPLKILYSSKWLNAAVVRTTDSSLVNTLSDLSFVSDVEYLYRSNLSKKSSMNKWDAIAEGEVLPSDHQVEMLQGHVLHEQGYRGEGMLIAVLDGGFANADTISGLDSIFMTGRILGTRSYVEPDSNFFFGGNGSHGTNVLSIMGGDVPGQFRGSAPKASYFLVQTEDTRTEFRIEEANWLAGAELADSLGADVINTSLGYSVGFSDPLHDYAYSEMDGKTTLVTRAAQLAAKKGIAVVNSAGNSGRPENPWGYITAPSDGDSVLAIGAVDAFGYRAAFSSRGPSADGRVKPDVMAQGVQTWLIRSTGLVSQGNGTSYSSPLTAGLVACLWQKNRDINNYQLIESIRSSASLNPYPDSLYGYGIPNFSLASDMITSNELIVFSSPTLMIFPNPASNHIIISAKQYSPGISTYEIYDIRGRRINGGKIVTSPKKNTLIPIHSLSEGSYIIVVSSAGRVARGMFIKL